MKTRSQNYPVPGKNSQCGKILRALRRAQGKWVSMPKLVWLSRSFNIHTRVDELRSKYGVAIENTTDRMTGPAKSKYRLA